LSRSQDTALQQLDTRYAIEHAMLFYFSQCHQVENAGTSVKCTRAPIFDKHTHTISDVAIWWLDESHTYHW